MTSEMAARTIQTILAPVVMLIACSNLLAVYGAIVLFVLTMFAIALAAALNSDLMTAAALVIFLAGTLALLAGALLIVLEIRQSHHAVAYEARHVLGLGRPK